MMRNICATAFLVPVLAIAHQPHVAIDPGAHSPSSSIQTQSGFLLFELGVGELHRNPSDACRTRISSASTFKIPHALAARDSGVITGPDEKLTYDGSGQWPESSRRDHTLASAIRYSVVWYFQQVALRQLARTLRIA
jgi:beta-lactamase class D